MKKYLYIMLSVVLAGIFGACSKDNPFDYDNSKGTGGLLTSALDVSLVSENGPRSLKDRNVRAKAPSKDEFKVAFFQGDATEAYVTYDYADMPEIVTLPVGSYTVKAYHGEDAPAAWNAPYYEGSSEFTIVEDQITESVDPIVCSIKNVRVSIVFTESLMKAITGDVNVTVNVGEVGSLVFTRSIIENGESGYFKYVENSNTLAATFVGEVDGVTATEIKTDIHVEPGRHYIITFRLFDAGDEEPGTIVPGEDGLIIIDSKVTEEDEITGNVTWEEDTTTDDMRPQEGNKPGTEDPTPDQPEDPQTALPSVKVNAPLDIEKENLLTSGTKVEFVVDSYANGGFTGFIVEIDSNVLNKDELASAGIPPVIDLINCDDELAESLTGFGFVVHDDVKGQKHVEFNINEFVDILLTLASFNEAPKKYYNFKLTVTDANGTTEKTLKLYNN